MRFDFVGRSRLWFALSAGVILVGLLALLLQGLNLGIDFQGGTLLQLRFDKAITIDAIRDVLAIHNLEKSYIQESDEGTFIIRTRDLSDETRRDVLAALEDEIGSYQILRTERVGGVISAELRNNAYIALTISALLMLVYIALRFEFKFAVVGILALIHDVLVTVGLFALFRVEIDSTFVAAILTIVGYSINATIVIFDRIRENLKQSRKESLADLVNRSISETLTRSINTSATTLFAVVALLLFGGETTKVFALALLIGLISGTYSSIFLASPLWYLWRTK
ncbi:MAG: protein translocase subunit SecF [Firmicutes bacterium]|nr:protein translocase subunit SecF [Bacillota bacterium]